MLKTLRGLTAYEHVLQVWTKARTLQAQPDDIPSQDVQLGLC